MQQKKLMAAGRGSAIAWMMLASVALASPARAPSSDGQQAARIVEKALQKNGADVHRCFEKALADRLDVAGKVEIEVTVGPGGRVTAAKLVSGGTGAPAVLSDCVQKAAAGWTVDGIEAGDKLVLPFSFRQQASQFVVKVEDVSERVPGAAPPGKAKPGPKREAPYTVRVLADEMNMRTVGLSLTQLNIGPASRVAMHRHPKSAKVLYLLRGHARLLGPAGVAPIKLDEGMAAFVPAGYPHAIENMGRQSTAVLLQAFAPPGPERVYRDPTDARGRADFEVVRDAKAASLPAQGGQVVVTSAAEAATIPILGGKGTARALLEPKATASDALTLNLLELANGAELPRHDHGRAAEILYLVSGGGKLTVGSEEYPLASDEVLYLPAGQPHAIKFTAGEKSDKVVAVQFLTSARAPGVAPNPSPATAPTKAQGRVPQAGRAP